MAAAVVRQGGVTAMKTKSALLLVAATVMGLAQAAPATADLIGTQVSGSFVTLAGNLFDPAFGFVPPGFGNSAPNGPNNVVISASQTEFGFEEFRGGCCYCLLQPISPRTQ